MIWLLLLFLITIWLIGVFYLTYTFYLQISRKTLYVPFIASDNRGIDAMVDAVSLKGNENVIDIGSGIGSIVFRLAKRFSRLSITGVEIHPLLHFIAQVKKILWFPKSNTHLERVDAAQKDYSSYDVVFLFMLSTFVDEVLVPKLEKELRSGTKVVSYVFKMSSACFKEEEVHLPQKGWRNKIYVYTKI